MIIKILLVLFLLAHIFFYSVCKGAQFTIKESIRFYGFVWFWLVSKTCSLVRRGIFHPLTFLRLVICSIFNAIFSLLEMLLSPTGLLIFEPFTLSIILPIYFSIHSGVGFLRGILYTVISLFVVEFILMRNFKVLEQKVLNFWSEICSIRKYFKNASAYAYADLMGMRRREQESPYAYKTRKKEEYIETYIKTREKRHTPEEEARRQEEKKAKKEKKKDGHRVTYLDIMFKNELMLFDLYMKDFTLDDLKARKKALAKLHHPDNYTSAEDIKTHTEIYKDVMNSYNKLAAQLEKEA